MKIDPQTFGLFITELRERLEIKQYDIYGVLDVSASTYSRLETGGCSKPIPSKHYEPIFKYFGVNLQDYVLYQEQELKKRSYGEKKLPMAIQEFHESLPRNSRIDDRSRKYLEAHLQEHPEVTDLSNLSHLSPVASIDELCMLQDFTLTELENEGMSFERMSRYVLLDSELQKRSSIFQYIEDLRLKHYEQLMQYISG